MAEKGDRAKLYDVAMRMYVDGKSLTEISGILSVSRQTLSGWKADSGVPGEDADGWDKAKSQKRCNLQRLKDLFERQMEYMEGVHPSKITSGMVDALSKLGALIGRWEKVESILNRLTEIEQNADAGDKMVSVDLIKKVREEIYGV